MYSDLLSIYAFVYANFQDVPQAMAASLILGGAGTGSLLMRMQLFAAPFLGTCGCQFVPAQPCSQSIKDSWLFVNRSCHSTKGGTRAYQYLTLAHLCSFWIFGAYLCCFGALGPDVAIEFVLREVAETQNQPPRSQPRMFVPMGIAALHPENLGFISTLPYHCFAGRCFHNVHQN